MSTLPTLRLTKLTHVGTFDAGDKGCHGASLEGHGLSVSRHPSAWTEIAKLGGNPWWALTNSAAEFLDVLSMSTEQRQQALTWAMASGLVGYEPRWRVSFYDDEAEEPRYFLCKSLKAAQAEVDDLDETSTVETVAQLVALPALNARMNFDVDDLNAEDLAIVCWCEARTALDGVWWEETFAPELLSAPRGVIFPGKLANWERVSVEPSRFDVEV